MANLGDMLRDRYRASIAQNMTHVTRLRCNDRVKTALSQLSMWSHPALIVFGESGMKRIAHRKRRVGWPVRKCEQGLTLTAHSSMSITHIMPTLITK